MNKCEECKFWKKNDERDGECRCNAPALIIVMRDNAPIHFRDWAHTSSDDWCGDFKEEDK